ncbi:citramalate synthase [Streptomyces sp. NPDC088785]|uniref:citramalate synthase n=1 Tax=Streptomyces sp. NPDC088785 TaxID=3365897 RepID=UPI00381CC97C
MAVHGVQLYDTTLRDGTQQEGMALTVDDKLAIARHLDAFGVRYIEGGWPGAIPKDTEFFNRARTELILHNAELAAFGATRRPGTLVTTDPQVQALLASQAPVITLVAKSDTRHVEKALRTTLAENLAMISTTVRHLVHAGRTVFVDAEHYFDAHRHNPHYALACVHAATEAGAHTVILCDTNGGSLPHQIHTAVTHTLKNTGATLGIHCHDDTGCAIANTHAALDAGATHAQGTAHGYGERCGNANLFTLAANLTLKHPTPLDPTPNLTHLTTTARAIAHITHIPPRPNDPYTGTSAFTHKAGLHASALRIDPDLYQHTNPTHTGNHMRTLVSDMGGRSSIELKAQELGYHLPAHSPHAAQAATRIKQLENQGYSYETADASLTLLLHTILHPTTNPHPHFTIHNWTLTTTHTTTNGNSTSHDNSNSHDSSDSHDGSNSSDGSDGSGETLTHATLTLTIPHHPPITTTATAPTPHHALDQALHQALDPHYPTLTTLHLTHHHTHTPTTNNNTSNGAGSNNSSTDAGTSTSTLPPTRILTTYTHNNQTLNTTSTHTNPTTATWHALLDAYHYTLQHTTTPTPLPQPKPTTTTTHTPAPTPKTLHPTPH